MIINAAIRKDGIIYTGKCHAEIINNQSRGFFRNCEQGFVDDKGEFFNRGDAAQIAFNCGQIRYPKTELFSEDIWRKD